MFEGGFLEFVLAAVTQQYPYHEDVVPGGAKHAGQLRAYHPCGDWLRNLQ